MKMPGICSVVFGAAFIVAVSAWSASVAPVASPVADKPAEATKPLVTAKPAVAKPAVVVKPAIPPLSADQKAKIKAIKAKYKEAGKGDRAKIKVIKAKRTEELKKPNPSSWTLNGCSNDLANIAKEASIRDNNRLLEIQKVLTPVQYERFLKPDHKKKSKKKHDSKK